MSQENQSDNLSPIKRALYEIRTLKGKLHELERAQNEPIAIVGLGMRFPGDASNAASLWKILADSVDTLVEIPASRWSIDRYFDSDPDVPGKMYTRYGHFISDPAAFDAHFFGISPREAASLDPQHRIALEVAWEALENAGCSPATAAANHAGVFLALSNSDYYRMVFKETNEIDTYSSTGTNPSVAAGRISYLLGLEGPSVVVDTACSGSLVTVHLACQSLRLRECRTALAGGVCLILSPEININFSKARMMAPDGRCKTFDARADGYVRGEGCGMVVLKRLSDAVADGDNVLAVIRGSAINQDGRSSGLTAPNGKAQEAVIRQALTNAGVEPQEIGYVEAHGTGTSLGDPIEAHALAAVLGAGRTAENPLVVGSVKTNLGHLEAAAGVAGLIKVVLSLQHERIPRHLHFQQMNPHINWGGVPVEIPAAGKEWKRGEKRRVAGVSSFGFSGTNAHVIVEEAPLVERKAAEQERPLEVLALSARTESALEALEESYRAWLPESNARVADICYTARTGRSHFAHRSVYLVKPDGKMAEKAFARGEAESAPEVVFVFTGQGAQYAQMGKELYESEPAFRGAMNRCAEILKEKLKPGLLELLYGGSTELLNETRYTQPANFALQYALAEMWKSWGVEPSIIYGHSVGECAAGVVAGIYSLEDGLELINERGRLTGSLEPGQGTMAAVLAPVEKVRAALEKTNGLAALAALNGPESVVISGRTAAVEQVTKEFEQQGFRVERLRVSHGFHSPEMKPVEDAFAAAAGRVKFHAPQVEFLSSVTGDRLGENTMADETYWRRQLREAVLFAPAMEVLRARGCNTFIEMGPGSTLLGMGQELIGADGQLWAASIRRSRTDSEQTAETLAQLYVRGVEINWAKYDAGRDRRSVPLPSYPFERQRYWIESKESPEHSAIQVDDPTRWEWIREAADRQSQQCPLGLEVAKYPARWAMLDKITTAYIVLALRKFEVFHTAGERHTTQSLIAKCGIKATYEKLLHRWLNKLANEGLLERDGKDFVSTRALPPVEINALLDEAENIFLGDRLFLDYTAMCGGMLYEVLTGRESALETLFPGGSFSLAEDIYERSPLAVYSNLIARSTLEGFLRSHGTGPVRVVEIGAGTGATASALVPALPPGAAEYHFTDVSDFFLSHAEQKFASYPFMRYGLFNVERKGAELGYPDHSFDVVVATNVIHATRDLRETMSHVKSLLAPGGILILSEQTDYLPWLDITVALIEGWHLFEDGYRGDHPLLPPKTWESILQDSGFERIASFPESQSPAGVFGRHVIVARVAATGARQANEPVASSPSKRQKQKDVDAANALELATMLDAPPAQRHENLVAFVRQHIADMLRFDSPERVERKRRLIDLGLDSLMAVELRNRLSKSLRLARPLSATLFFEHPTLDALVDYLERDVLKLTQEPDQSSLVADPMASRADQIEDLDDSEVEAMLLKKLESL